MKGLVEKSEKDTVYLVVKHHSICQESKVERQGFEPVEVINPRSGETSVKFIKRYDTLEALVTKIEWRDTGDQYDQRYLSWRVHLDAAGTPCILEIPFKSRISSRFMKVAENLNFTQPVELRAWHDKKTDSTAFFCGQGGVSVPQRYSKDEPGDCPPPEEVGFGEWNFSAQNKWLHGRMINIVIPAVEAAREMHVPINGHDTSGPDDEFDSDAPF